MPSAANGDFERHASSQAVEISPVRRVVEILQSRIASLEKQKNKISSNRDAKSGKDQTLEQKVGSTKAEEISQMLEFTWDLCKQVMGIAILTENEAKKVARKESALRKSQDTQLVHEVLLILDCLEQLSDPAARADFLAGECGAAQLTSDDLLVLDNIYPEITPKHVSDDGEPVFETQSMAAAKHLVSIIDGIPKEVIGTTYAHIKNIVASVHGCGYFNRLREPEIKEEEPEVREPEEEPPEEPQSTILPVPAPASPAPLPPAPQAVPPPAFPTLPPRAPPVTLQQVEHAYFARYGRPQKRPQPVPEVFGPQSFIFLQESEIDAPELPRQPVLRPVSPGPIPSQTFTNQTFAVPQHFVPDLPPGPHADLPPPALYPPGVEPPATLVPGFPVANPPPPIPMPPSHPAHPVHPSQPLPSPSFPPGAAFLPATEQGTAAVPLDDPSSPAHNQDDRDWNEGTAEENRASGRLEIDEWNPTEDRGISEVSGEDRSASGKFRPRGQLPTRGRGAPGGYRGRGNYQNGRSSGSYYRNDGYQSGGNGNVNGNSYGDNYRDTNNREGNGRYENSQGGGYQGGYKGRGGRGAPRQGPPRGAPRTAPARGQRTQFARKPAGQYESRGAADAKQQYAN